MKTTKLSKEEFVQSVIELLPMRLTEEEQLVSIQIYRLLAEGEPVSLEKLAMSANTSQDSVKAILDSWPGVLYDVAGRINGYWGLALPKMAHRFKVDGKELYAWCAWDTLFMPELIGKTATVESTCPVTKEKIRLTVEPDGSVKDLDPAGAVMSILTVGKDNFDKNIIKTFCHFVYFFSSEEAGNKWAAEHDGTNIISIEEGVLLSSMKNRAQYKDVLGV